VAERDSSVLLGPEAQGTCGKGGGRRGSDGGKEMALPTSMRVRTRGVSRIANGESDDGKWQELIGDKKTTSTYFNGDGRRQEVSTGQAYFRTELYHNLRTKDAVVGRTLQARSLVKKRPAHSLGGGRVNSHGSTNS